MREGETKPARYWPAARTEQAGRWSRKQEICGQDADTEGAEIKEGRRSTEGRSSREEEKVEEGKVR
jgi:hypothetical protein